MKIKELLREREGLVAEAKGIFALADKENRALTDAELARDDDINARITGIDADIERRKRHDRTVAAVPDANRDMVKVADMRDRTMDDPRYGFSDMGEFAMAVRDYYRPGGRADERLQIVADAPTNFHRETGSDEGRMVPPAYRDAIFEAVTDGDDNLLNLVDAEPTNSNSVILIRDESTPWGSTGVQARWRAEGTKMDATKLVTDGEQVRLHELYAFVLATSELLGDAPRLADRLTRKAGLALRYRINEAIVNGTGAGQPLGWFTHGAKVTVAKEGSQAAVTVLPANIAKMYARLINPGQGIWFINQDVLPQLITLNLANNIIYMPPATGFTGAPGGFLLGRPVIPLENCQTLGTVGDIQFVNPNGYYAAHQGLAPQFASSMHLFFDYNVDAFRWLIRLAGQPYLSAAVSPAKGSSTRAHVVVLATRE
jgi:HK97 family phage major capsid protein